MTTPTLTAEEAARASDPSLAGLPDVPTLTRWANELFATVRPAVSGAPAGTTGMPNLPAGTGSVAQYPSVVPDLAPVAPSVDTLELVAREASGGATSLLPTAAELPRLAAANLYFPVVPIAPPLIPDPRQVAATSAWSDPTAGVSTARSSFYFLEPANVPSVGTQLGVHPAFDVGSIRADFPILKERIHGRQLVWFDNAATTQKPAAVIERLNHFYRHENSNVHRAAHELAARSTDAYEAARSQVQRFLGAASPREIVFARGATEAINLVAQSWGRKFVGAGDEILISHLEHHANIVPWQMLASERGARLRVVPVDDSGQIRLDELQRMLSTHTRLLAVTHVANALGTVTPVREMIDMAHRAGARVLIDGAQSVSHIPIDLRLLDADFFALSGHKIFGPTGIGVLYGKLELLESMPPWQGGGNMIEDVTFERTLYQPPPVRFEAGTGNIADAVGLGAALEYLTRIGMPNIERYESELLQYAIERLCTVPGLSLVGTAAHRASVLSFVIDGLKPEAVGSALNEEGIAVRAGHHCAQPILRRFGYEATVRASLAFYNTREEVDAMVAVLRRLTAPQGRRRV